EDVGGNDRRIDYHRIAEGPGDRVGLRAEDWRDKGLESVKPSVFGKPCGPQHESDAPIALTQKVLPSHERWTRFRWDVRARLEGGQGRAGCFLTFAFNQRHARFSFGEAP